MYLNMYFYINKFMLGNKLILLMSYLLEIEFGIELCDGGVFY